MFKYIILTIYISAMITGAISAHFMDISDNLKAELSQSNRIVNYLENWYIEPETFPYIWPVVPEDYIHKGRLSSYYGYRNNPLRKNIGSIDMKNHYAVDMTGVEGARVQNVGWGTVIAKWYPRGWHNGIWYAGHPDFNGYVEILLDTGYITKNGHIYDITVHEGERVAPGKVIGRINPVADIKSTGPHLHFGMLNPWGQPVQPLKLVGVSDD